MRRKLLISGISITALLLITTSACNKEENSPLNCDLKGYAFFTGTSIPISGVLITVHTKNTSTDGEGFYKINDIPCGNQTLTATREGYDDISTNIELDSSSRTFNIDITSSIYTHTLSGNISSKSTGLGIDKCKIAVLNPDASESQLFSYTSSGGYYQIPNVPEGDRTILLSEKCYFEIQLTIADSDYQYDAGFETELVDSRDGKVYDVVEIGEQVWMAENLNYGERIDGDLNQEDNLIAEKYCYDNDEANCIIYGGLYQWDEIMRVHATKGTQATCPDGWHVPEDSAWTELVDYLGGPALVGNKLKEMGTSHWREPNTGATNESGFTALPSGYRNLDGQFTMMGMITNFWTATKYSDHCSWYRILEYDLPNIHLYENDWKNGRSVRCIRN